MSQHVPELALITFIAAVVNGALGYGFSSITVPLALMFLTNRVLNPALVLVEVALNAYVLWINRDSLGAVFRRMLPIVAGVAPAVIIGTLPVLFLDTVHHFAETYRYRDEITAAWGLNLVT